MMETGLQSNKESGFSRNGSEVLQAEDFRMGRTGLGVEALGQNFPSWANQNSADHGVGIGPAPALCSQFQSHAHIFWVLIRAEGQDGELVHVGLEFL